jgi:hypothetical protein
MTWFSFSPCRRRTKQWRRTRLMPWDACHGLYNGHYVWTMWTCNVDFRHYMAWDATLTCCVDSKWMCGHILWCVWCICGVVEVFVVEMNIYIYIYPIFWNAGNNQKTKIIWNASGSSHGKGHLITLPCAYTLQRGHVAAAYAPGKLVVCLAGSLPCGWTSGAWPCDTA